MSLNWSVSKVHDWEQLHEDPWESVVTEAVVFKTMPVGIWKITEANYEKFFRRVAIVERMHGPALYRGSENVYLTLADIHRRIGLQTNADTLTDKQFLERITSTITRSERQKLRAAMEPNHA